MPLLEIDWQLYTETFGQVMWAFANPEFGRGFGEVMRVACDQETHRSIWRAWVPYDVTPLLPAIAIPTLVVHNKENRLFLAPVAQRLAASIRGARLSTIDDITYSVVPDMIERFVHGSGAAPISEQTPTSTSSGMTAILFADIVDSTALTERLGDAAFRAKARDLDAALRTVIRDHAGTPIEGKLLGDGVLAVFTSARQAIEAALACGSGWRRGVPPPPPRPPRRRRHPRGQQRLRRRRQHRLAHQRPLRAGRSPGVGDGAVAGAHVGGRDASRTAASSR